jgi:2-haloalkanoic acid dehalogenase type II
VYAAVMLDVYGTLVRDDDAQVAEVAGLVAARAGADPRAVAREWTRRVWRLAETAHGTGFRRLADLNVAGLAETATHFGVRVDAAGLWHRTTRLPPLFADSVPFLAAAGVPVCLVSDADHDSLHAVLAHHRITVDAVVTSEDARAYKPRPEPFRMALRRLGVPAAAVVHAGDSPAADIAGAAALGIATALVSRDGRRPPARPPARHTVTSLTALLPLLRRR